MKILLTGANGQLSHDLQRELKEHELFPLTHAHFDITDIEKLSRAIVEHGIELVINTAAYHRVDEIETNAHEAFKINAFAVQDIARICHANKIILVHISTDYVFGGDTLKKDPYVESDRCQPLNVYGCSKLAGELLIQIAMEQYYIVRSSGLYGTKGPSGKGLNFVERMIKMAREGNSIRVVNDQRLTPTSTRDLSTAIAQLIKTGAFGLYHITNEDSCTWYEFACEIFRQLGLDADLSPISTSESGAKARRPGFSVLSKSKLYRAGIPEMSPWQRALTDYLVYREEN